MATCRGHRLGTNCYKNSRSPKANNWKDYQLCYKCFCILILEKEPKKGHGGKYLFDKNENGGMSLIATEIKTPLS